MYQKERGQKAFVEAPDAFLPGNLLDSMYKALVWPRIAAKVSHSWT